MKKSILALSLLLSSFACSATTPETKTSDPVFAAETFLFEGVKEVINQADTLYILNRHTDEMWKRDGINNIADNRARTQSGIRITFRTDSRTIKPLFEIREGTLTRGVNNHYGVYLNGKYLKDYPGTNLVVEGPQGINEWTLVLPIMYGVNFKGVKLDEGAKFYPVPTREKKPIYIAIGDSITHGAGLTGCSSVLSYPYVLAETNNFYLYNTAIGGSQISPGIAYEYEDIQADFITVMWGYNDWNATKGDLTIINQRYKDLLTNLLSTQKKAKIYCILPTVSTDEKGGPTYQATLGDVREEERKVALSMNSSRIIIIEGYKMTSTEDLNGAVHFHNNGSVKFGKALSAYVK